MTSWQQRLGACQDKGSLVVCPSASPRDICSRIGCSRGRGEGACLSHRAEGAVLGLAAGGVQTTPPFRIPACSGVAARKLDDWLEQMTYGPQFWDISRQLASLPACPQEPQRDRAGWLPMAEVV